MSDDFGKLVDVSNVFFRDLKANNTRDWYAAHKDHYTNEIKKPAELMGDLVAQDLSRLTGKSHGSKLFRINRDVRFSKDKSPFNTHLHLLWRRTDDEAGPVFFFGTSPDYLIVGCGLMFPSKDGLTRLRAMIDARGDDLEAAMNAAGATLSGWGPDPLKRVPKPYAPDHPHAKLLKRKNLTISVPPLPTWRDTGLIHGIVGAAASMMDVWTLLDDAVT